VKKEEEEDSIYSLYVSSYICETTLYCKAEDDNANGKEEERYDSI